MNDDKWEILVTLYELDKKSPGRFLDRLDLLTRVGIDDEYVLHTRVMSLEKEGYVKTVRNMGPTPFFSSVFLTSDGAERVLNGQKDDPALFTFELPPTIAISGSPGANAIIGDSNTVEMNFNDAFKEIYKLVEEEGFPNKLEILERIQFLENEIPKKHRDMGRIKATINWLKTHAYKASTWLYMIATLREYF